MPSFRLLFILGNESIWSTFIVRQCDRLCISIPACNIGRDQRPSLQTLICVHKASKRRLLFHDIKLVPGTFLHFASWCLVLFCKMQDFRFDPILFIKAASLAGAAAAAGWGAFSSMEAFKTAPTEEYSFSYLRDFMEEHGIGYVMDRFITDTTISDGLRLKLYLFESSPGDPSVVFVPGTSVYALLYGEFLSKLADNGFNVIGFDCRGHGLSEGGRGSYTLGQLVGDTRKVISYAIERYGDCVAVAGSSQGGIVAFYAAAADARLRSAVCHNLLAPDEPDNYRMTRFPELYRYMMRLLPLASLLPGELRVPVSMYLDLGSEPCRLIPDVRKAIKNDPMAVMSVSLSALASLSTTPLAVPVERIEVPIMVVHSQLDNIFPEDYVRRVFNRLTCRKKMVNLKDAPHLVLIDFADEIMPEIVSWLNQTMGRAGNEDKGGT